MEVPAGLALADDEVALFEVLNHTELKDLVDDLAIQPLEQIDFLQKMGNFRFFADRHWALQDVGMIFNGSF